MTEILICEVNLKKAPGDKKNQTTFRFKIHNYDKKSKRATKWFDLVYLLNGVGWFIAKIWLICQCFILIIFSIVIALF